MFSLRIFWLCSDSFYQLRSTYHYLLFQQICQCVTFLYFVTKKLERTLFAIDYCGRGHLKSISFAKWHFLISYPPCHTLSVFSSTHHSPVSFTKNWQTMVWNRRRRSWTLIPFLRGFFNYLECLYANDVGLVFLMTLILTSQLALICSQQNIIRRNSSKHCSKIVALSLNKQLLKWSVFMNPAEHAFA